MYAEVVVPLSVDGIYTYSVPSDLEAILKPGMIVTVPFAGNKRYSALVTGLSAVAPEGVKLKAVERIAEHSVFFSEKHIKFLRWIWDYYLAFPGDVLRAALPVMFRLESVTCVTAGGMPEEGVSLSPSEQRILDALKEGEYYTISELVRLTGIKGVALQVRELLEKGYVRVREQTDPLFREQKETFYIFDRKVAGEKSAMIRKGPSRRKVCSLFTDLDLEEMSKSELLARTAVSASVLKDLCEECVLHREERTLSYHTGGDPLPVKLPVLTPKQSAALQEIRDRFLEKDTVLLHGVTSSGKTEIYITLINRVISEGGTALFMLPEITLTVQIIRRLKNIFGGKVGIYHSGMSDRERAELWHRQCSDAPYPVILGVRSSLFLPFRNLKLIVVDEEHDTSYKQKEPSPRYSARDAAIVLAGIHGAKVLLGSATPSFESYHNAMKGKYGFVELDSRYGDVALPRVEIADMKEPRRKKMMQGSFTPKLVQEMREVLDDGGQVILFQNRRGYSSFVKCDRCGDVPHCPNCDVSLTYYKYRNEMVCRYCGKIMPVNTSCTTCGEGVYQTGQPGTEKIEEEVAALFPEYPVGRMDLDVVSSKKRLRNAIHDFENGKTRILIGTQLVVKGLDFANVRLVGILNADSIINFPDFRAEERAFSQMLQVAGRSGRRKLPGKVVIQASNPEHRVLQWVLSGDYKGFYNAFREEREYFMYPPYARLISLELRHKDACTVRKRANALAVYLRSVLKTGRVEGPVAPEISRINSLYRVMILLKIPDMPSLNRVKHELRRLSRDPGDGCRLIVDVDVL